MEALVYRPWTEQRVKEKERIYKELLHGKANETTRRRWRNFEMVCGVCLVEFKVP